MLAAHEIEHSAIWRHYQELGQLYVTPTQRHYQFTIIGPYIV